MEVNSRGGIRGGLFIVPFAFLVPIRIEAVRREGGRPRLLKCCCGSSREE